MKYVVIWQLSKLDFAKIFIGVYSDVALCKGFLLFLVGVFLNVLSLVLG
jgi:hypothetical protein